MNTAGVGGKVTASIREGGWDIAIGKIESKEKANHAFVK
ncbi:hypothetical protein BT93_L0317 [Corymbia citriodora subsp. variegata]|nr:hypothetical protein BT93_L0317 [Corymbia citriodora subsp. variegata]